MLQDAHYSPEPSHDLYPRWDVWLVVLTGLVPAQTFPRYLFVVIRDGFP